MHEIEHLSETCSIPKISGGLTKRELLAAMAMQGICTGPCLAIGGKEVTDKNMVSLTAKRSIEYADALLAELAKGTV